MMSNILGKTINAVFNTSDSYAGLQGVYKQILAVKTKKDEEKAVLHYISIFRERLKDPGLKPNFIGHCLAFAVFCETLGYSAKFSHIYAINLAQQTTLPEKKMGYAACCCLLKDGDDLCLLLVNTLIRDLSSTNVVLVGLALTTLCSSALPTEITPSLLPAIIANLTHQTAYIRSRAVIAAHHLIKKCPTQFNHIINNLIARLGDEDPHVVSRVLSTLTDVIQVSPENVSGLVPPLVAIQRQILNGKLPNDMNYNGLNAPWMQLNIIRILPELALTEEDVEAGKEVLIETLNHCSLKEGQIYQPEIKAALVSQTLASLISLEGANDSGQSRAMLHINTMLNSASGDIKHEGLQLLGLVLSKHNTTLNNEQKEAVMSSLTSTDVTVRRRALSLLVAGAASNDVQNISGLLFSQTNNADSELKIWLLDQVLGLMEKFSDNISLDWKLSALVKMMPITDDINMIDNITKLCQSILLNDKLKTETRNKLLNVLSKHTESKQAPTCLLNLYIWTISNFPEICSDDNNAINRLIILGSKILQNSKEKDSCDLLLKIVRACTKAFYKSTNLKPNDELNNFLAQVKEVNNELNEAALELTQSLPILSKIRLALNNKKDLIAIDCTLSALDSYVTERLRNNTCRPYQPQIAASILQPKIRSPSIPNVAMTTEINLTPSPKKTSIASEESWSVRSLTSPTSPEITSPVEETKLIWSRKGRSSTSPERVTSSSVSIALALSGTTEVKSSPSTITDEDPLGELLR